MKGKNLLITLGLAITLGIGVGAGLGSSKNVKAAHAATNTTIYTAIDVEGIKTTYSITDFVLKCNVNRKGDGEDWASYVMQSTGDTTTYEGKTVYSANFTDLYDGLGCMQIQVFDGSTWKAQDPVFGDGDGKVWAWTTAATYNNKLVVWDTTAGGSWVAYTPTTYTVAVYVDGVKRGDETVAKNALPDNPELARGKSFSGWFDDADCTAGHEVTGITGNTTVYGKISDVAEITYNLNAVAEEFETPYLYAYEVGGRANAAWPGAAVAGETFTVYADDTIIISNGINGEGCKQTANIAQSGIANDTLVVTGTGDNYFWLSEKPTDGYYVVGSKTSWTYEGATKMLTESPFLGGNTAVYFGYVAEANEEIKVRSWFASTLADTYYNYGPYQSDEDPDNNYANYVFAAAGSYDIFLNNDDPKLFWVTEHVARHNVAITSVLFEGAVKAGTQSYGTVEGNETDNFAPALTLDGYVYRGLFTDEACSMAYVSAPVTTDDLSLYAKFTKVGHYLIFGASSYGIDGAKLMLTEGIAATNKAEGSATFAVNDTFSCVYYNAAGEMEGQGGLGQEYAYAENETDHIKITAAGTYSIYWGNDNKVYLNTGIVGFCTNFISQINSVCDKEYGKSTDPVALKAAWDDQEEAFGLLTLAQQDEIRAVKFDGGDAESEDLKKQVVAAYSYIVLKYGTDVCKDFIWGETYPATTNGMNSIEMDETAATIIVVISVATIISAAGLFLVLKRKKHAR